MNCNNLKKSYIGIYLWLALFFVFIKFSISFMERDIEIGFLVIGNVTIHLITLLAYIIYRTGYVYWYSGISYEDALNAGEDRRKQYSINLLKQFHVHFLQPYKLENWQFYF